MPLFVCRILEITKENDCLLKKLPADIIHYLMSQVIFSEPHDHRNEMPEDLRKLIGKLYSEMRDQLAKNSHT